MVWGYFVDTVKSVEIFPRKEGNVGYLFFFF